MKPLFDVNTIIDYRLSVIHMILDNYYSDKYMYDDIDLKDDYYLRCMITENVDFSPLSILIKDSYELSDNLYDEFLEDDKLKEYFVMYDVGYELVGIYNSIQFIHPTVLCRNQDQVQYIKAKMPDIELICTDKAININNKYDAYFTSDIRTIDTTLIDPRGLHFKIFRLKCNLEQKTGGREFPKMKYIEKYLLKNRVALVDPYKEIILPE
jgi:hypothetical protein